MHPHSCFSYFSFNWNVCPRFRENKFIAVWLHWRFHSHGKILYSPPIKHVNFTDISTVISCSLSASLCTNIIYFNICDISLPHRHWWSPVCRTPGQRLRRWWQTWWRRRSRRARRQLRTGRPRQVCRWLWCQTWSWQWATWQPAQLSFAVRPARTRRCSSPSGPWWPGRGQCQPQPK